MEITDQTDPYFRIEVVAGLILPKEEWLTGFECFKAADAVMRGDTSVGGPYNSPEDKDPIFERNLDLEIQPFNRRQWLMSEDSQRVVQIQFNRIHLNLRYDAAISATPDGLADAFVRTLEQIRGATKETIGRRFTRVDLTVFGVLQGEPGKQNVTKLGIGFPPFDGKLAGSMQIKRLLNETESIQIGVSNLLPPSDNVYFPLKSEVTFRCLTPQFGEQDANNDDLSALIKKGWFESDKVGMSLSTSMFE